MKEFPIAEDPKYRVKDPYLVFIIFVYLKQFAYKGIDEKEAWTIPIKYKGEPFLLTLRKFGFKVIAKKGTKKLADLGREAMYKIHKAVPYAETLIQPVIKEKVQKGNITLENHYREIFSRYEFFKKKAKEQFKKGEKPRYKTSTPNKNIGGLILLSTSRDLSVMNRIAGNNYGVAMLDTYFSLLEHILVLVLPFIRDLDHEKIDVEEFLLRNWKEKIKFIVPLSKPEAAKYFESLLTIKENLRNPLTHGHFQKGGHSILVHMKAIGAIPMNLSKRERHFQYSASPIYQENFETIVQCFEGFIDYLSENTVTRYAMKYITSGLDVAFDGHSRSRYQAAMTDATTFDRFIEQEQMYYTNAMNMDW